ncbi:MAG: hypothetical protein KA362_02140 [Chloroflexi bacterium]|nr:hypothetical protein [Chloroflexota bacterium]MBK8933714.1 hypothetical protein [Chloroflexota bacterium]MBP6802885.1 hypothetical protein [Chloroflexota bacterium]MBP7591588.1 hypothetical protein [Chloroflexota bacterium]
MANEKREELEKRVKRAYVENALFRWESAVIISLTVILAVLSIPNIGLTDFLPTWAWLLAGLLSEAGLVASSLTDKQLYQKIMAEALHREFDPKHIDDKALREQFLKAVNYRRRIETAIQEQPDNLLKDELQQAASQIDNWIEHIYNLAQKISRYRQRQQEIERDKARAQRRIQELDQEMILEDDEAVKKQMGITIQGLQQQLATLSGVENTMQRAELQIENSLAHLGTIYSQALLVDAKDIDSSRAKRLRQEISDEVTELNEVLLAMDEVYTAESS